ncbi:MAG: DUF423 domain-containing protein [Cyclobacteriaceae bacterium]|nr:DUF423 domain-containing protein [Cyclobacteriaceae bacterium]
MNQRVSLLTASLFGLLGVALGAFGAHALKAQLTATGRLDTFELAVRYQFYHAFALLTVGLLQHHITSGYLKMASVFFFAGTLLFSGSLYILCLSGWTGIAMVTPFGGVLLIFGWLFLAVAIFNSKK